MKIFRKLLQLLFFSLPFLTSKAVPPVLNYAGQVSVQGEAFEGNGLFKFAIVSKQDDNITSHWSNDGSSTGGSEPDANVSVQVSGGLYSILLGNASISGMSSLNPAIFSSQANLQLRVWFSDGVNGFQHLSPDRTFASVPYALSAGSVNLAPGSISRSMLASGILADLNATIPRSRLALDIINDLNASIGKNRLSAEILSDLNATISRSRLAADILADLNRTISHSMLDSNIQSILDNANRSSRSATISGEHNITNESIIFVDRNATGNLLVNLPSASTNDGRSIRLVPTNGKPIRIESLSGELNGGDWANLNQSVEIVANQGVWFPFGSFLDIGIKGKVKDIYPGFSSSSPSYFTDVNGTLFFRAQDGTNGYELWKSDGTSAGTTMLKDIRTGSSSSSPHNLTDINGTLFFIAQDATNGQELWKSDGTSAGTTMLKDIRTGSSGSYPQNLTDINGTLFFSAQDPEGQELWKIDP